MKRAIIKIIIVGADARAAPAGESKVLVLLLFSFRLDIVIDINNEW
jgi:hypothetical protein